MEKGLKKEESTDLDKCILNSLIIGITVIDDKGKIVLWNPMAEEILGYTKDEIIGQDVSKYFIRPPGFFMDYLSHKALNEDIPVNSLKNSILCIKGTKKDGSVSDIEIKFSQISIDKKQYLVGQFFDITERKATEEKLNESEELFKAIFDNAIDGILLADENKSFLTGNKSICKMLDYSYEEIKSLKVIDIHPKEDLPYVLEQFEKQTREEFTLAKDIPMKRKDGSVFYADVNSTPIEIAGKKCLLGIFRDITERKTVEQEKNRFMSFLNHDFRNAISPMSNVAYIFEDAIKNLEKEFPSIISTKNYNRIKKSSGLLTQSVNGLEKFLEDLTNFTRTQTEKYKFEECNMYKLVNSIIQGFSKQLDEANVTVKNNLQELELICDQDKISRLWINYITNAIKYSKGKKHENVVEIGFTEKDNEYEFYVKDNGRGIAKEDIPKLNIPGTRLHTTREDSTHIDGTGLGLAIIKEIISKHGGTTRIESKGLNEGSTFFFTLPKKT